MSRKNKRPVFDEGDSDSDTVDSGFKEYLDKKSLQSTKKAKSTHALEAAKTGLLAQESSDLKEAQVVEKDPSFIEDFLKSKRQRELDTLHLQSVRNRLENELQKTDEHPDRSFITEGYKVKREDYDRAELQAVKEEQDADEDEDKLLGGSSRGLALRMLISKAPNEENPGTKNGEDRSEENKTKQALPLGNDVYRSKPYVEATDRITTADHPVESFIKLQPEEKESCIREFLRSRKSTKEIKMHIEKYNERQQQTVRYSTT